jgi:hypothetical protein
VYDQGHKQYLEENKRNVTDEINEDMMNVMKNEIVYKIHKCTERYQGNT